MRDITVDLSVHTGRRQKNLPAPPKILPGLELKIY